MATHRFSAGGYCVWCSDPERKKYVTRELVADRRAPPFCEQAPDDEHEREFAERLKSANGSTGY